MMGWTFALRYNTIWDNEKESGLGWDEMKRISMVFVAIVVLAIKWGAGLSVAEAVKMVPTGGGYNAACLDYGLEMRDKKMVKSCLLATSGDFPAVGGQQISCTAKYSIAFSPEGKVEYCTLSKDMSFRRTSQDTVACMAGGRAAFYPDGTLEVARLKDTVSLPYAKNSTVACRAASPISFRTDGKVATCILDQESLFVSGVKKKTSSTCQAGGLIAFDEFGSFNGCYPPPPVKATAPTEATTQGGPAK